jgi:predicted DsbA family dithiol-disulfide isomerase
MDIDIYSDPVCPWCFIGKRRLERALSVRPEVAAVVHWRTFQLNPTMPPDGMARDHYLHVKFGSPNPPIYDAIRAVGKSEGIEFAFDDIQRTPNTQDAHRMIRFASQLGSEDAFVEALFQAYFFHGQDIGNHEILTFIAVALGLDSDAVAAHLASDTDLSEVREEGLQGRQLGIQGVPCFVVAGRYAVSGAQEPEAFFPLFDMACEVSRESEVVS